MAIHINVLLQIKATVEAYVHYLKRFNYRGELLFHVYFQILMYRSITAVKTTSLVLVRTTILGQ